jgi:uncharacterized protein
VRFLGDLAAGNLLSESVAAGDWMRMAELVAAYRDLPLGTTDASVIATAERLGIHDIATFDRRHFTVVRSRLGDLTLLPCLPGDMASKATAFEHLEDAARPGAVVFGATLLHGGVKRNRLARTVMTRNNKHRIFSNADDDLEGLSQALSQHVDHPVIEVVGCVALFAGRR